MLEVLTGALILASIGMNLFCEKSTEPDLSKCGSGRVQWDEKAGICRDLASNLRVPDSCCGR